MHRKSRAVARGKQEMKKNNSEEFDIVEDYSVQRGKPKPKEKKHYLYRFFNPNVTKDVPNDQDHERNFAFFFTLWKRNITNLLYANLIFLFANFPIWFFLMGFFGLFNGSSTAPTSAVFANIHGASLFETTPILSNLQGVYGVQSILSVTSTATLVLMGLSLLIFLTHGPVNIGLTYILRSMVRGEPIFWKDFFTAIRKNFGKALIIGIIDLLIILLLGFNIYTMRSGTTIVILALNLIIGLEYIMMRFYIYLLALTFDLSIFKVITNSFRFAILGVKRNIVAFLGIVAIVIVGYMLGSISFPILSIYFLVVPFGLGKFMGCYAAWPKIKELMID